MKFFIVALLTAILIGCQGWNYGLTPYAGVNGSQDGNLGWNAGVAFGITTTNSYVPPPMINQTNIEVKNNVQQSQTQSQDQSQNHTEHLCHKCGRHHNHDHPCRP